MCRWRLGRVDKNAVDDAQFSMFKIIFMAPFNSIEIGDCKLIICQTGLVKKQN